VKPAHLILVSGIIAILGGLLVITLAAMQDPAWSTPGRNPTHATPSPWPSR